VFKYLALSFKEDDIEWHKCKTKRVERVVELTDINEIEKSACLKATLSSTMIAFSSIVQINEIEKSACLKATLSSTMIAFSSIVQNSMASAVIHPSTMHPCSLNLFLTYLLKTFINLSKGNI
jgi:hypothetical protein